MMWWDRVLRSFRSTQPGLDELVGEFGWEPLNLSLIFSHTVRLLRERKEMWALWPVGLVAGIHNINFEENVVEENDVVNVDSVDNIFIPVPMNAGVIDSAQINANVISPIINSEANVVPNVASLDNPSSLNDSPIFLEKHIEDNCEANGIIGMLGPFDTIIGDFDSSNGAPSALVDQNDWLEEDLDGPDDDTQELCNLNVSFFMVLCSSWICGDCLAVLIR
ncbi:hypothetical protein M5K25_017207 [Dendrobium thyrsiflorum]|uniref:Uncharacterized protein n=1 Tax=Dendrobium thyrsiflorum TaxID=117978 RepID=A0ABD0UMA2_DENTH